MSRTLFDIGADLEALYELLEDEGGEVSEATEGAIDSFFAELGAERDKKIDGYCYLIKQFETAAAARRMESIRLASLAQSDDKKAERLKKRLQFYMQEAGLQRLETPAHRLSRAKNGGAPSVSLSEFYEQHPVELPERFRTVVFKPNLKEIGKALADGDEDVRSFASLKEKGEHLKIK